MTCDCGNELQFSHWRIGANAYYWAVMLPTFARELFHDIHFRKVDEQLNVCHLRLKWELLPFGDDLNGTIEANSRSIKKSKMCDECFKDYLNRLSMLAGMEGIEFPQRLPDAEV